MTGRDLSVRLKNKREVLHASVILHPKNLIHITAYRLPIYQLPLIVTATFLPGALILDANTL